MEAFRAPLLMKGVQVLFSSKLTCSLVSTGEGGYAVYSKLCYNVRRFGCSQEFVSGSAVEYLEDVFSFCGVVSYFWW